MSRSVYVRRNKTETSILFLQSTPAQLLARIRLALQHLPKIEPGSRLLCFHWLPLALQLREQGEKLSITNKILATVPLSKQALLLTLQVSAITRIPLV